VLHKDIPFFRIGLPLCIGVISGLYFKPDITFLAVIGIIISGGLSVSIFFNNYLNSFVFGVYINLLLFICGLVLYTNEKSSLTQLRSEATVFTCTLSDFPAEKENSFMLNVELNRKITRSGSEYVKGSMLLYIKKDTSVNLLLPGDLLVINCTPSQIVNRGNPCEFDYRFYMENQGIRYYAFLDTRNIIIHFVPEHRKLVHRALIIREKIIEMYCERGITGERLALVAAMTLGQRNMLEPEQKQNFIKAGVMHIMAVSGLHSVILSLFVFNLLFFMKGRLNSLKIIITIILLWAFAFVTGLTPSVLRATLMFSFLQTGKMMKRHVNGINMLLASAFVLIVIKPSVLFDAGFLLSYAAVLYIMCFYQDFYLKLKLKNSISDKIWQSVVITIVAQAGTLPLTIMLFNRFPILFIFTNTIIVPISSLLIIVGCLVPLTYPVYFLSHFIALILNTLTGITEFLTATASSPQWSNIENIGMTALNCAILFAVIFAFFYFLLKKRTFSIIYPIGCLILFILAGTYSDISTDTTNELIVYNTPGSSTIGIKRGKMLNVFSDTIVPGPEIMKHCATLGLKSKINLIKNKVYLIELKSEKIIISNYLDNSILNNYRPDIVILTGLRPFIRQNLSSENLPKALIITSEAPSGYSLQENSNTALIDTVHLVRKSGAFTRRI
jgi:competence protein ComEC